MGLKCSLLGHSYEPAGVEREREKQGSEVVTVSRELERCTRCDAERVISESTEVTAVVDADGVGVDGGGGPGAGGGYRTGGQPGRADARAGDSTAAERAAAAVDDLAEGPDSLDLEDRDPEEEDAEILTDDDEQEREPGQWPDETEGAADDRDDEPTAGSIVDPTEGTADGPTVSGDTEDGSAAGSTGATPASDRDDEDRDEESLAGITVPDEAIVCPECGFGIEAESGYREGDPCPECGSWLESERNP